MVVTYAGEGGKMRASVKKSAKREAVDGEVGVLSSCLA